MRITNELSALRTEVLQILAPKQELARLELFRRQLNRSIWSYYMDQEYRSSSTPKQIKG